MTDKRVCVLFCFFLHLQCCVLVVDSKVRNNKERTLDAEPSINMINPLKLRQSCKLTYFKTELYCWNKIYFGERKTFFTSYMFFGFHSFKHPFLESIHYLITVCKKKNFIQYFLLIGLFQYKTIQNPFAGKTKIIPSKHPFSVYIRLKYKYSLQTPVSKNVCGTFWILKGIRRKKSLLSL